jgi:hypothetical protein
MSILSFTTMFWFHESLGYHTPAEAYLGRTLAEGVDKKSGQVYGDGELTVLDIDQTIA